MESPIFLFSLPRSGSTLLQRMLICHDQIASISEAWIMLPLIYTMKDKGVIAEYSHFHSRIAMQDMIDNLENKKLQYYNITKQYASEIYNGLCHGNEKYFLDKTPRYYLVISEITKIFPDAKFIFLFRNPVQVYSSILQTWHNNRFLKIYMNEIDLKTGPRMLSAGYDLLKTKAIAVNYDHLVFNPERELQKITDYLGIKLKNEMLQEFNSVMASGRLGDKTGTKMYNKVNKSTGTKWKKTFNSPLRKAILRKYVIKLDTQTLSIFGLKKEQVIDEINKCPVQSRKFINDFIDIACSRFISYFKIYFFISSWLKEWVPKRYLA